MLIDQRPIGRKRTSEVESVTDLSADDVLIVPPADRRDTTVGTAVVSDGLIKAVIK